MRDLVKYPISKKEIVDLLTQLEAGYRREQLLGDMRPLLLQATLEIVKGADNALIDKVLAELNPGNRS